MYAEIAIKLTVIKRSMIAVEKLSGYYQKQNKFNVQKMQLNSFAKISKRNNDRTMSFSMSITFLKRAIERCRCVIQK